MTVTATVQRTTTVYAQKVAMLAIAAAFLAALTVGILIGYTQGLKDR